MPEAKTTMKASNAFHGRGPQIGGCVVRRASNVAHRAAEHVLERAGEQDDEALDDDDHVAADLRLVEGELGAALIEHAEQDRGEDDADRMGAAHQRDRDADEAEAADEVEDEPVLVAEDHVDGEAAGERARKERRDDGHTGGRDAAVDRRGRVGADGADLVTESGAPDEQPEPQATEERKQERQVEGGDRPCDPKVGEELVELRHKGGIAERLRLGVHLPGLAHHFDKQVTHDRRGDVVEHDRRDDDVAVAIGLQIARYRGESRAEHGRADDGRNGERVTRQDAEVQRHQRRAETGDIGLPLRADVEQAGVEADRHRKPGEDETGRKKQRESDALEITERAGNQDLHRFERVLADRQHDETGNDESGRDVDERNQRNVGPLGQGLEWRTHAARSLTPAIRRPRS